MLLVRTVIVIIIISGIFNEREHVMPPSALTNFVGCPNAICNAQHYILQHCTVITAEASGILHICTF